MSDDCQKCCEMVKAADQCPHARVVEAETVDCDHCGIHGQLADVIGAAHEECVGQFVDHEFVADRIADAVLSSGLVVPVGERDDVLDEMQRVLAERDAALAIVANVRGEIGRWDGYGHGLYNTHYESQLPCAVCDVLDEFRAALDTTPRA